MDSSNSGSFQSSSGPGAAPTAPGDTEEFDSSTPHSISSFFNHFNPNLNHLLHPPPPPPPPPPTTTTFFTPPPPPFSTYPINPNPSNTNTNTNKDHHHHHHQDHHHHHQDHQDQHHHHQDNHHQIGVTMKNPKKRTRASRRAPTTVLTTDTTNFRQMVQEFTGIPTSPFTATSFSRRLELFRPTAQKVQPPAPPLLNPMANNNIIVDSSTSNNNNNNITSSSYQLHPSSIHDLQKQPSTLLDLQNHPMLSFQSLLQTSVPQESSDLNGLQSTSGKRWRDQNEKLESFEDDNIVRSNVVVSSRSGGDQAQGNNNQRFMDLPF